MVDTIAITIPEDKFRIFNHDNFSPSTKNLFEPPYIRVTGKSPFKAINNPTKEQLLKYGYMPRLTVLKALRRGGFMTFLRVEFSAPKLIYGNNFDELDNNDFKDVCTKLKEMLFYMGVIVRNVEDIEKAEISAIHYSKNIILSDYSTPSMYLEEIRKINVNKIMDMNQTDFQNEGHAVKYRCNDFEVIFYDKLKDLEQAKKSKKRSVEKDNFSQLNLFASIKPKQPFEVLRLEVRIGSRRKLRQILSKYGFNESETSFYHLFSTKISQKILSSIMDDIDSKYPEISKSSTDTLKDFLIDLGLNNSALNYSQLLKFVGAKALLDELGVREFRNLTGKFGNTSWYRLNRSMKTLKFSKRNNQFDVVKNAIHKFNKIQLEK